MDITQFLPGQRGESGTQKQKRHTPVIRGGDKGDAGELATENRGAKAPPVAIAQKCAASKGKPNEMWKASGPDGSGHTRWQE